MVSPSAGRGVDNIKMERENDLKFPPAWCSRICRNSMNEVCAEHCAVKRNCSYFELKPHIELEDMDLFPLKEWTSMTKEERGTSVTIYISKIVEHLKGCENGHDIYNSSSGRISENIKIENILSRAKERATTCSDREKCPDSGK